MPTVRVSYGVKTRAIDVSPETGLGERLAVHAEQTELDQDEEFNALFVRSLSLCGDCGR